MPTDTLLSRGQAAAYLDIHPQTLHRWVRAGKVRYIQKAAHGQLYFRRSDLDAMLAPKQEVNKILAQYLAEDSDPAA